MKRAYQQIIVRICHGEQMVRDGKVYRCRKPGCKKVRFV